MRTPFPALLPALALVAACLPTPHFADISDTLARRDLSCPGVTVAPYEGASWAFRAAGCGQVAYYRCSYGRKSMGSTQCCQRVATEEAATALFAVDSPGRYCEEHTQ